MSEWWTYTLSDFLLFSAQTYHRLFELHHRDVWPLQPLAVAAGAAMLALANHSGRSAHRAARGIAALAWLWVAWSWHGQRYATINWAAPYIGVVFALQGFALLVGAAASVPASGPLPLRRRLGVAIIAFALFVQPLTGLLAGRRVVELECFGITPGPTVAATLGLLLAAPGRSWALAVIPVLTALVDGATLWVLAARDAWVAPALAALAVLALARADAKPPTGPPPGPTAPSAPR